MKKIIKLFNLILKCKFKFKNPKQNNLILFDDVGEYVFENVLYTKNYSSLQVRLENIETIYVSWNIFLNMIRNFNTNLLNCYLIALIKIIDPKVILTSVDNSFKFSELAKILYKNITFIAVQNASRYDFDRNQRLYKIGSLKQDNNKRFFIPHYYCFGDQEVEDCKKFNIEVLNFYKIGSLRLSQYLNYLKKNQIILNLKKFDISLISESSAGKDELWKQAGVENGFAKIVKFTIKFCLKNNLSFVFVKKRENKDLSQAEMIWYQKFLDKNEFEFISKNSTTVQKQDFISYKAIHQSKVSIGTCSTLLREKLALKGKILACNFTPLDHYDFPIKGICFMKNPTFEDFEKRIFKILKINNDDYFSSINNKQLIKVNENNTQFNVLNKNIQNLLSQ